MTDGISNNLKSTLAYQIAAKLDAQDGNTNGEISASIWNKFVEDKGGKQIKESISLKSAMNSITTYLVRQAKSAGQTVDTLAQDWLGKVKSSETPASGETKKSGGTQQAATTPPAKAPISDVPQKKTFPPAENIPENDPNPPIMSDPKMKGKPDSEVKQKDGTTYCYDSNGRLSSIKDSKGQKILEFEFNDDGSMKEHYNRYEYDAKGNVTRYIACDLDGKVTYYEDYEYNSENQRTNLISRNADGSVGSFLFGYNYNSDGKEARIISYNADGSVKYYEDYEYDVNGNKTKEIQRDASGNLEVITEYDKNGDVANRTYYNPDGTKQE